MSSSASDYEVKKGRALLFMTFGALLVIVNLLLVEQNKKLKVMANSADRSLELVPGKGLPGLHGLDPDGNRLSIDHTVDGRKTIMLVFSPGCRACKENMPYWKAIMDQAGQKDYRVIAVSLKPEGTKDYISRFGLADIPVIAELDAKDRVAYNLVLTPQAILISPNGTTEKVWTGLMDAHARQDAERTLNVNLSTIK